MRQIKKGSTDRSVILRAIDSTDGTPETGIAYNTAGIDLWYRREGGAVVSITEVTLAAVDSAHSDGGVIHVGNGYFRLDSPDAAFATGSNSVMFGGTATGMIIIGQEVQLVNYDPEDTVRLGLTSLPNAAADAAGGLPISDTGGLDLDTLLSTLTNGTYGLSALETLVDEIETALTNGTYGLNALLTAIGTRLASAGYTVPDNTNIGNIHTIVSSATHGNAALKTLIDALNDLSQSDIRTAIGMATANMDTQLTAIAGYINTEITTIINAIAALHNLSEAQVNAQCDLAISDAGLATAINLTAAKTVIDTISGKIIGTLLAGNHTAQSENNNTILANVTYGLSALKALIDIITAKTNTLPSGIKKGVALNDLEFVMVSSTDHITGATGLTVSGYVAKDGGAFVALTGVITEKAYGVYNLDSITLTEMSADIITLRFTATGADDRIITIKTVA